MKLRNLIWLCAIVPVFALYSCSSEVVSPKAENSQNNTSLLADASNPHPDPSPVCSERLAYDLMDETGSTQITYCGFLPCDGTEANWGNVEVLNSDSAVYYNFTLEFGWYIENATVFVGDEGNITVVNGIPVPNTNWSNETVNPIVNAYQAVVPYAGLPQCFNFSINVSAVQLDFFQGVKTESRTSLWIQNDAWNDQARPDLNTSSPAVNTWCVAPCGPEITSVAGGDCEVCDAEVNVDFVNCGSVDISSCKDLSNVVLVYTDCEWEKFEGLNSQSGSFSGTGINAGKDISHIYVKSGCYKSGEGPGFGRRFDGPCVNAACPPMSNGNGGKNK